MLRIQFLHNILVFIELILSSFWNRITILILTFLLTFSSNKNSFKNNGLWLLATISGLFIIIYFAGVCNLMFGDNYYIVLMAGGFKKESEKNDSKKKSDSSPCALEITLDYLLPLLNGKYIFDCETGQWYQYNKKNSMIWNCIDESDLRLTIIDHLREHPDIQKKIEMSFLINIIKFLRDFLKTDFREFSQDNTNLIPFNNGILNLVTSEFIPFSSKYRFTSKLNINYDPNAKMHKDFIDWLLFISEGSELFLRVIRSFVYLILTI